MLDVGDAGLAVPVRRARVAVAAASGTVLFTGYIATEPEAVYEGTGFKGAVYRYAFSAVSDEWLLDKQPVPLSGAGLAQSGGELLTTLTEDAPDPPIAPAVPSEVPASPPTADESMALLEVPS